jgi:hypothetical protein
MNATRHDAVYMYSYLAALATLFPPLTLSHHA